LTESVLFYSELYESLLILLQPNEGRNIIPWILWLLGMPNLHISFSHSPFDIPLEFNKWSRD